MSQKIIIFGYNSITLMETQSQREKRKNNKNPLLVSEQTG